MEGYKYVPGYGSAHARLAVCGEAPGKHEEEEGKPLVGPTGQEVRSMLRAGGISPEECWYTNVFKYRPPGNDIKKAEQTGHSIEEGVKELWEELKAINPNCVLGLGALALNALTGESGIKKWRGSILPSLYGGFKVVSTIHPANLFERRGEKGLFPYSARVYIGLDIARAVEESLTKEYEVPHRNTHIAKRSLDLYDFLERKLAQGKRIVSIDIEAHKCVPMCIGLAFDKYESLSIPLINLGFLDKTYDIKTYELAEMWRLLDELFRRPDIFIIGQNFKYDQQKLECIGFRFREDQLYADTSLLAKLINPEFPAALEFSTSIYTREPYYKDEYREFNPARDKLDRVFKYNGKDCTVTFEVFEELIKEAKELGLEELFFGFIMKLHPIYKDMEDTGFGIDFEMRDALYKKYSKQQIEKEDRLFELTGYPVNCNSPKQVQFLLYETLRLPRRKDASEDTLVQLMANRVKDEKKRDIINHIIDIRRIRNAKSKIAFRPDYDGRLRTGFRLAGTEAGRTSTSVLKRPVRPVQMGMSGHSITKHGELGGDVRKMLVPTIIKSTGQRLRYMNADLSQAEARVVALLSDDKELLSWFEQKIDVHARTAWFIFGGKEENYRKSPGKEPPERHIGKIGRHAYGYGTSANRLMLESNTQARRFGIDIQISQWRAGEILKIMDQKCPAISETYWPAIRAVAHGNRTIRTAHGRIRQFLNRLNDELYREMYSYIPQADVADQTKKSMVKVRAKFPKRLRFVMEAHDAFLIETFPEMIDDVAGYTKEVMQTPIDYEGCTISRGMLTIPCDVEIGDNYKEFTKWKGPGLSV